MAKEPRISKFYKMPGDISLPGSKEGESVKEGGSPAGQGLSSSVVGSVTETPSIPSGDPAEPAREASQEEGSPVAGRTVRRASGKGGRSGRSRKDGAVPGSKSERIYISANFFVLLGYEKFRRKMEDGGSRSVGDLVEEAYLYYLKKNARDVYDRYVSMGLIDP